MKRSTTILAAVAMLAMFSGAALAQQPQAPPQQAAPRRSGGDNGGASGHNTNTRVAVTIFNNSRCTVNVAITVVTNGVAVQVREQVRPGGTAQVFLAMGGAAAVTAVDVTPIGSCATTFRGWRGHMTNPSAVHIGDDGSVDLS